MPWPVRTESLPHDRRQSLGGCGRGDTPMLPEYAPSDSQHVLRSNDFLGKARTGANGKYRALGGRALDGRRAIGGRGKRLRDRPSGVSTPRSWRVYPLRTRPDPRGPCAADIARCTDPDGRPRGARRPGRDRRARVRRGPDTDHRPSEQLRELDELPGPRSRQTLASSSALAQLHDGATASRGTSEARTRCIRSVLRRIVSTISFASTGRSAQTSKSVTIARQA